MHDPVASGPAPPESLGGSPGHWRWCAGPERDGGDRNPCPRTWWDKREQLCTSDKHVHTNETPVREWGAAMWVRSEVGVIQEAESPPGRGGGGLGLPTAAVGRSCGRKFHALSAPPVRSAPPLGRRQQGGTRNGRTERENCRVPALLLVDYCTSLNKYNEERLCLRAWITTHH